MQDSRSCLKNQFYKRSVATTHVKVDFMFAGLICIKMFYKVDELYDSAVSFCSDMNYVPV